MGPISNLGSFKHLIILGVISYLQLSIYMVHCSENGENIAKNLTTNSNENIYGRSKSLSQILKTIKDRRPRQDDGDDGDEEPEINFGVSALAALAQLQPTIPQVVTLLTEFGGAVNNRLNGSDTPTIPMFLAKQVMQALQLFMPEAQSTTIGTPILEQVANLLPKIVIPSPTKSSVHIQDPYPTQKTTPRPNYQYVTLAPFENGPPNYEYYPTYPPAGTGVGLQGATNVLPGNVDWEDYLDNGLEEELQESTTISPLPTIPPEKGFSSIIGRTTPPPTSSSPLTSQLNQEPEDEYLDEEEGLSLWELYKIFQSDPNSFNGTADDFYDILPNILITDQKSSQSTTSKYANNKQNLSRPSLWQIYEGIKMAGKISAVTPTNTGIPYPSKVSKNDGLHNKTLTNTLWAFNLSSSDFLTGLSEVHSLASHKHFPKVSKDEYIKRNDTVVESTSISPSPSSPAKKFPPGKPAYWMNMYYPNGVPTSRNSTSSSKL